MTTPTFNTPKTPLERAQYFMNVSAKYTNGGYARLERHYEYSTSPEAIAGTRAAITTILGTGFLFSKTGQIIGKGLGKMIAKDETDGHLGSYIGGGTGFVVGVCTAGVVYLKVIESTESYQNWVNFKLESSVKASTTYSYSNDPILENYCCPLSLCIIDIPVYTPSGTLYDFDFIDNCPRTPNNLIKDPSNNPPFHHNDLKTQKELAFFIKKRLHFLVKKDLEQMQGNPEVTEALNKQLVHVQKWLAPTYEMARKVVEDRRKNKVTSPQEYKQEIEEFEKLFGVDENQHLDWNLDWQAILKDRFQSFNPTAITLG
jgi:hypothetical protein